MTGNPGLRCSGICGGLDPPCTVRNAAWSEVLRPVNYGIDDDFIGSVREQVTEGTSALFLLTGSVTLDKVEEEMKGRIGTLIKSNLTHEQEAKLNAGFGEE